MRRTISILKVATVISFLLVIIPNEKFLAPVGIYLLFLIAYFVHSPIAVVTGKVFYLGGFGFFIVLVIASLLCLIISLFIHLRKKVDDIISVSCVLILFLSIIPTIRNLFRFSIPLAYITYSIFAIVAVATLILLLKDLVSGIRRTE